eukprot:348516-Rhodomonas_salina.1
MIFVPVTARQFEPAQARRARGACDCGETLGRAGILRIATILRPGYYSRRNTYCVQVGAGATS